MNPIRSTRWHGMEAWSIESESMHVVMVPQLGAKIVSLLDKRSGLEWLIGPGDRPVKPIAYGAPYHEQDLAGWDEMFPTIVACVYPGPGPRHGTPLPDHGEAWALPWSVTQHAENALILTMEGRALPYRLTRAAGFTADDTLTLRYTLINLGAEPMPYMWAAHPQVLAGSDGQVIFPPEVTEVINTIPAEWGWGPPETRFDWPEATGVDGSPVRLDRVGPPSLGRGRKLFALPHQHPAWAAVLRRDSGHWLRLDWDADQVTYLGLWVDEGALNHASVAAPEPITGWYDDLALAWDKGEVTVIPAGATHQWTLTVRLGADGNPVPEK